MRETVRQARKRKRPRADNRMIPPGAQALKAPRRCAAGHLVVVWPCIECTVLFEARHAVVALEGLAL